MTIKVKCGSGKVLREWARDEYASWEDDGCPDAGHVYNVLSRHSTVLELRGAGEAALVTRSGAYFGDASGFDDGRGAYHAAVGRITRQVEDAAKVFSELS